MVNLHLLTTYRKKPEKIKIASKHFAEQAYCSLSKIVKLWQLSKPILCFIKYIICISQLTTHLEFVEGQKKTHFFKISYFLYDCISPQSQYKKIQAQIATQPCRKGLTSQKLQTCKTSYKIVYHSSPICTVVTFLQPEFLTHKLIAIIPINQKIIRLALFPFMPQGLLTSLLGFKK